MSKLNCIYNKIKSYLLSKSEPIIIAVALTGTLGFMSYYGIGFLNEYLASIGSEQVVSAWLVFVIFSSFTLTAPFVAVLPPMPERRSDEHDVLMKNFGSSDN